MRFLIGACTILDSTNRYTTFYELENKFPFETRLGIKCPNLEVLANLAWLEMNLILRYPETETKPMPTFNIPTQKRRFIIGELGQDLVSQRFIKLIAVDLYSYKDLFLLLTSEAFEIKVMIKDPYNEFLGRPACITMVIKPNKDILRVPVWAR